MLAVHVKTGDEIKAGDVLAELASPEVEKEQRIGEIRARLTDLRLARRTVDGADREDTLVLERERTAITARLSGLRNETEELVLRAPAVGRVIEVNPAVHAGRWIGRDELVAVIGAGHTPHVLGYVSEDDVHRIKPGARGRFIPDDPTIGAIDVELIGLAESAAANIEIMDLISKYGGHVATSADAANRRETPVAAQYPARFAVSSAQPFEQSVRGIVRVEAEAASPLSRFWRHAAGVLIRESGF